MVLAGDYNVIPEDRDTFSRRAMANDALFQPESQAAFRTLVHQGWTDALRALHPDEPSSTPSGTIRPARWRATPASASTICCAARRPPTGCAARASTNGRAAEEKASDHAPTWVELRLEAPCS